MKAALLVLGSVLLSACSSTPPPNPTAPQADASAAMIGATTKSPEALAHFRKGEAFFYNLRTTEATEELSQAIRLDPDFVLAHLYHGSVLGAEGAKETESAADAAAPLPAPERLFVEALAANSRGEFAQATTALRRVVELAPADWRGHYALGFQLLLEQKYTEAVAPLKKATTLNGDVAVAQNMLGYAALGQGDAAGAIEAFQQYVRLLPQEPNPQDSLGEALMAAGRFKEAEAAFQQALTLSPDFWNAHEGIAYARFYAGDWAGGRAALTKAKAVATRQADKFSVDEELAAASAAQRRTSDALQILTASERTAGADTSTVAFAPVRRALILIDAGRYREALPPIAVALKAADGGQLLQGRSRRLRLEALRARVTAESLSGDAAAAEKTAALLDQEGSSHADDPAAQTAMHFGRAMVATARGDVAGARAHFDKCSPDDEMCKWQLVATADKAADKTGAAAARDQLLRIYKRNPVHLVVRSRLAPSPAT